MSGRDELMARGRRDLDDTISTTSVGRLERLGEAVSRIRGGRRMDADRLQLIIGGALAVLGLVAILIGWMGASKTGFEFEQIPYLISGGLLGLALCFLGGFVYFAYWVTRLVRESRAQSDRAAELLDRIAETLDGSGVARNGSRSRKVIAGGSVEFYATKGGTFFHTADCAALRGRDKLRKVTPKTPGLEPCRICDPLATD
jgi:hypothetical protein